MLAYSRPTRYAPMLRASPANPPALTGGRRRAMGPPPDVACLARRTESAAASRSLCRSTAMRYRISITWMSLLIAGLRYRLRLTQDLIQERQRDCRGQAHGTRQSASALAGSPAWQLDAARSARTPSSSDGSASGPGLPDSAGAIRRCQQISAPLGRQRGRDVVVDHNHLEAPSRLVRRRTSSPVPTSRSSPPAGIRSNYRIRRFRY